MSETVNDNQQIDLQRIQQWAQDGKELAPQIEELISLIKETGFLDDIQKAREGMIIDDMLSEAGFTPGGTSVDDD